MNPSQSWPVAPIFGGSSTGVLLLMEEIGYIKPCKPWDKPLSRWPPDFSQQQIFKVKGCSSTNASACMARCQERDLAVGSGGGDTRDTNNFTFDGQLFCDTLQSTNVWQMHGACMVDRVRGQRSWISQLVQDFVQHILQPKHWTIKTKPLSTFIHWIGKTLNH